MGDSTQVAEYYAVDAPGYARLWAPALLPASEQLLGRLPISFEQYAQDYRTAWQRH